MMLSLFKHYNIIPIFIFDGKPPPEKKTELDKRRFEKLKAKKEITELQDKINNDETLNDAEKEKLLVTINNLKYKSIFLNKTTTEEVKRLIIAFGMTYYDALNEADELCALLVVKNKVWACMSDDSDMFAYGCNIILRHFDLLKQTFLYYDLRGIVDELGITQKNLREICVLSCNDYNNEYNNYFKYGNELYTILKYFKGYKKSKSLLEFREWLIETKKLINDEESELLYNKINNLYQFTIIFYCFNFFNLTKLYLLMKIYRFNKFSISSGEIV